MVVYALKRATTAPPSVKRNIVPQLRCNDEGKTLNYSKTPFATMGEMLKAATKNGGNVTAPLLCYENKQSRLYGVSNARPGRWQVQVSHIAMGGYACPLEAGIAASNALMDMHTLLQKVPSA